jgi:hypothetical protein
MNRCPELSFVLHNWVQLMRIANLRKWSVVVDPPEGPRPSKRRSRLKTTAMLSMMAALGGE